jgi:uncharacterized protein involved in exopolysaccharide biosynthesis
MHMSEYEDRVPERSLRDVYYILFRHQRKVIAFFLAVIVTVTVGTLLSPKIYQSEAKLMVLLGRESVSLDPTATTGPVISVGQSRENEIKSELEILKSRELVEKVVDAIGPIVFLKGSKEKTEKPPSEQQKAPDVSGEAGEKVQLASQAPTGLLKSNGLFSSLSDRDRAILTVTNSLEIEALKNSNIITVSFEAKERSLAQETINKLIGFYLSKHVNVHRTAGSYEFFSQQTDQFKDALAKSEEALKELKNKNSIASLLEQRSVLLKRIGDLQQEIEATQAALAGSSAKVWALNKTLTNLPENQVVQETTGVGDIMRSRLYELQLKEQDLLSRYKEDSVPVREIRRQIAEAKALMDKEEGTRKQVTSGLNEAHKQVQVGLLTERANLSSLQAKLKELRTLLARAQIELKTINDSEVQLAEAEREMSMQEANYRKYHEKLEQARIDQALEVGKISNISLVQPATYPVKPVRPRKMLNLVLGLFLGMFGSVGLAFFSEYMDHTFKKPEDVEERLQLPTMASIPASRRSTIHGR